MSLRDRLACAACCALVFVGLPAALFLAAAAHGWRP